MTSTAVRFQLVGQRSGRCYAPDTAAWAGDDHELLDLEMEPTLDPAVVRGRPATMWRYREVLPIENDADIVTLGEGCTPLVSARLAGREVLLKQESLCPTGSYKDRGASVLISRAKSLGIRRIVEDSSGNAGAAMAAYCARAGLSCDIYVPSATSRGKLAQIEAYGARLQMTAGDRQATADAAWNAAQTAFYASHVWQPWFLHGTKTFAYEIVEQLGWRAPSAVVMAVGNGSLLLGAYLGFRELQQIGLIESLPRLIGVQVESCAPLAEAWRAGKRVPAAVRPTETIAEGIAIARPARGAQCLEAVSATGGLFLAVSDAEIRAARDTAARKGFFVEPTAAVDLAALGKIDPWPAGEVVVAVSGHGLKSPGGMNRY